MRIATHRFIVVFSMALTAALTLGALSQNVVAQEATSPDENQKQIALTDAQIESFIGAQKEMVPIVAKAPQGDQPDPKVMEELEAVAKKYKFANYAEYHDVAENIGLVMSGIDPDTKKYVGPDAVIKKHIAFIDSENLAANDKKGQLDELQSKLKSLSEPVKFPANIDLVVKNHDKINAAMPPVHTRDDAQALVAKTVAAFNEKGAAVFEEINAGGFRDLDLYIFVHSTGPDAKLVAYGGPPVNPPVLGRPTAEIKGLGGLPIGKMFEERATPQGTWVDYRWKDPATGETADKSSWVVRVGDYIFGCGVYKAPDSALIVTAH